MDGWMNGFYWVRRIVLKLIYVVLFSSHKGGENLENL